MGRKLKSYYVNYIIVFVFFLLIGLPILYTFTLVFFEIDFIQYAQATDWLLLLKSTLIAGSVALIATLWGGFLAFWLYKTRLPFRKFFKLGLLLPLLLSPYILAVAWKDFFYLLFDSNTMIRSSLGVIWVLSIIFSPLAMLIIGSALSNIEASIEESALLLTKLPRVLLKISVPLLKPAFFTSFVLIFIFSLSEFSVASFLGVKVFSTEIFTQFAAFYNYSLAVFQSFWLVLISGILLYIERKELVKASFLSIGNKGLRTKVYPIQSNVGLYIVGSWLFISVLLPIGVLCVQSFNTGIQSILKAFRLLAPTFFYSIRLSFQSALFMLGIGFVMGYYQYTKKQNNRLFNTLTLISFVIPSSILGISLIQFYNHHLLNFIYASHAILLIAWIGKFSFIAVKIISNNFQQIPISLEEAAVLSGISYQNRIRKILLPLLAPGLFITFIISFIFSFENVSLSIMVYPPGSELLPVKVFTLMANTPQALISSMSLLVLALTLLLISLFYILMKLVTATIPTYE